MIDMVILKKPHLQQILFFKQKPKTMDGTNLATTCRNWECKATFPRDSFDWSKKVEKCIGTNNSWGNWQTYSSFVQCPSCKEMSICDEIYVTK